MPLFSSPDADSRWLAPLDGGASLKKAGVGSFIWLFSSQMGRLALFLFSTLILVRLLPPSDFGLLAMAATVTNFLVMFKDAGLTNAVIQQKELTHKQVSTLFWLNQLMAGTLMLVTLFLAYPISVFYHEEALVPLVVVLAFGFLVSGLSVQHDALLRRAMKFKEVALLDVGSTLLAVLFSVGLAWAGWGWWALVVQKLAQFVFYTLGAWWLCDWRPARIWHWQESKGAFHFGAQISLFNFVNYFSRNGDNVMVGWYWGPSLLGIYAKSYDTLLAPLSQISAPLSNALLPLLSRVRDDAERYRALYLRAYTPAILALLPIGVVMFCLPEAVVAVVFGPGWDEAVPVLRWLGLAVATQLAGSSTGTLLMSQQRGKDFALQGAINSVLCLASFALGLPWGIGGVAFAYMAGYLLLQQPLMFWIVGRVGPVNMADIYGLLKLPLWCALFMVPALFALRFGWALASPLMLLLVGVPLALAVQLGALVMNPRGWALLVDVWGLGTDFLRRKLG